MNFSAKGKRKQRKIEVYIDKTGKFVITPQFDNAVSFSEGLARVEIGGKKGYIKNPLK